MGNDKLNEMVKEVSVVFCGLCCFEWLFVVWGGMLWDPYLVYGGLKKDLLLLRCWKRNWVYNGFDFNNNIIGIWKIYIENWKQGFRSQVPQLRQHVFVATLTECRILKWKVMAKFDGIFEIFWLKFLKNIIIDGKLIKKLIKNK